VSFQRWSDLDPMRCARSSGSGMIDDGELMESSSYYESGAVAALGDYRNLVWRAFFGSQSSRTPIQPPMPALIGICQAQLRGVLNSP
jgi:hypothetical protein